MAKDGVQWRLTIFREENTGALHSYRNLKSYSVAKGFTLSGQHSTEVAFKVLIQPSQVQIPAFIDIYAINNAAAIICKRSFLCALTNLNCIFLCKKGLGGL